MTDHEQLVAYIATLATLVLVFAIAVVAAACVPALLGKAEVFGLGTITGGLIGVLRLPARAGVNVQQADQVGPNGPTPQP